MTQRLTLDFYERALEQKPCRFVEAREAPALVDLIKQMIVFCLSHNGVGLAAPQVGIYIKLAVVLTNPQKPMVLVNPSIWNLSGRDLLAEESCLSIPPRHNTARVWRSEFVQVKAGTLDDPFAGILASYSGYEARVVQHEVDHLDGTFFINRCGPVAKQIVLGKYRKLVESWQRSKQR